MPVESSIALGAPPEYATMGMQELHDSLSNGIDLAAVKKLVKEIFKECKRMQRHAGCTTCDLINLELRSGMVMDAMESTMEVMFDDEAGIA